MVRWFNYTSSVFWVLFLFLVLQLPKGIVAEENIMIDDKSIVYPDPTELYKSSISLYILSPKLVFMMGI